ncbi:M1 family metallopeptidase [Oceanihabitans sp. IOP_32]|uniref:M1 family metallopeptidase n=1 Tax=Oceanihabitans sp. IOP_32 TaxID=2529032 RepID=UPI001293A5E4|nr:M1 family metallopeptidase [Oceanihabitans sp. IOP_32]QFZ55694.1 M1 family metallopeptidase [Oceanihabitans sp. IOP_32]
MKFRILFSFLQLSLFGFSQQTEFVDFKTAKAEIYLNPSQKEVSGTIYYTVKIIKDVDSVFIDANNFKDIKYILNNEIRGANYNGKHLIIKHNFKANSTHRIKVTWKTNPKKAIYFINWANTSTNNQIWTQGQGKYTSNWLPSIDDMNEKIEFDLTISFNSDYQVIANGKLKEKEIKDTITTWRYDMQKPMPSYLVILAIGKYHQKVSYSKSGIPLKMYYYPEEAEKFEPTYRYTKQIFDFLEDEIGVPYPWQNYKQVPVKDFLYAGMENTGTTIFSDTFVVDSIGFVDKNYVNINAHELAHQWFGNLVTAKSSKHHWLQEGFATYYALLAERHIFGDNYYYWQLYQYANELLEQEKNGASTALLNPKSSSTTFYKKGCLALHVLRAKIGDRAFRAAVKNYLIKHQFNNVETLYFLNEVEKTSNKDISNFVETWLNDPTFYYEEVEKLLRTESDFLENYIQMDCKKPHSKCGENLRTLISDEAKIKIIDQKPELITKVDFNNAIKVRQAIARNILEIPLELKEEYESLLDDKSYNTIEMALATLWKNFPNERHRYLRKTKDIYGFNNHNVKILWLTLALITDDFEPQNKMMYFETLTNYTSDVYGFGTRQNALQYLVQIQACNRVCRNNLELATKHHNWRFAKFAKGLLAVLDSKK